MRPKSRKSWAAAIAKFAITVIRAAALRRIFRHSMPRCPAAERTGNLTMVHNAIVQSVEYDAARVIVSPEFELSTLTNEKRTYTAKVIFLNASTIASAMILLQSKSETFPQRLGESFRSGGPQSYGPREWRECLGISKRLSITKPHSGAVRAAAFIFRATQTSTAKTSLIARLWFPRRRDLGRQCRRTDSGHWTRV